ncbi:response regulator transcription factor [Nocardiopsis sp. HNM0947]|uniref:Response regulator transcription factor n=1 Tax=Nocardiopsis coralli TaxID=2772213 RepID=A0ABR9PEV3_9ACTN|nr:LuxR C-terminal-related transcriptional regulator [Nocardiopsis coralli]MBE3002361.1 response regulator transcription factor [Nocardiopsis coralli]
MPQKIVVSTSCSALNRRIRHAVEAAGWAAAGPPGAGELPAADAVILESDQLCAATLHTHRGIPVIGVMYGTDDPVWQSPEIGELAGIVDRDDMDAEYTAALRTVLDGRSYISQGFAAHVLCTIASRNTLTTMERADLDRLSAREREVVELASRGAGNAEISATLMIEVSTVKFHVSNILRKLDFRDRTELVARLGGAHLTPVAPPVRSERVPSR